MLYTACRISDGKRFTSRDNPKFFEQFKTSAPCLAQGEEEIFFIDVFAPPRELVVLGGGHVALYTVRIAAMMGFKVTVVDDRAEFASFERFPDAANVICADFKKLPEFAKNAFYVIVTRGHEHDTDCLCEVLKRSHAYIGMIGSAKKVKNTFEELAKRGFSKAEIEDVHAPIGLKIGAKTPAEIAVSICAELCAISAGKCVKGGCDSAVFDAVFTYNIKGVLMTVISSEGSSPAKTGAKAFLCADGRLLGTIGGGAAEHEAIELAKNAKKTFVKKFVLNGTGAMICGGTAQVLFEPMG